MESVIALTNEANALHGKVALTGTAVPAKHLRKRLNAIGAGRRKHLVVYPGDMVLSVAAMRCLRKSNYANIGVCRQRGALRRGFRLCRPFRVQLLPVGHPDALEQVRTNSAVQDLGGSMPLFWGEGKHHAP